MKRPSAPTFDLPMASLLRRAEPGRRARAPRRVAWLTTTLLLVAAPVLAQTNVSLTTTPSSVKPGGRLAYGVTVFNEGGASADFDLSFTWDAHLQLKGVAGTEGTSLIPFCIIESCEFPGPCLLTGGTCKPSGICAVANFTCIAERGVAKWTILNLAPGKAATLTFEHEVDPQTPLTDPEEFEPQLSTIVEAARYRADGSLEAPIVRQQRTSVLADGEALPLVADLAAIPTEVRPGEELAYRLNVINKGAVRRKLRVNLDLDPDFGSRARHTDTPGCDDVIRPICVRFESTERFEVEMEPAQIFVLRVTGRVAAETLKTELRAHLQIVDDETRHAMTDDEVTTVLVCEGKADGAQCDNGDTCTADVCREGNCVAAACPQACDGAPRGAPCSDGNACTLEECDGNGQCVPKTTGSGRPLEVRCSSCQQCVADVGCSTVAAQGKVCRMAFGTCDVAEVCDGVSPLCPEDLFKAPGTTCDDGDPETVNDKCVAQPSGPPRCDGDPHPCGNGVLDAGEQCDDGNRDAGDCCSPSCQYEPAGTACDDDTVCNGRETCDGAGSCTAGAPLDCDAGTVCATGSCDPVEGCVLAPAPASSCVSGFRKASLLVNEVRKGFESLSLKLASGPKLDASVFGDPTAAGGPGYTVCFYRRDDGGFAGDLQIDRAGQSCGAKPCWRRLGARGFQYTDRDYATDGVGVLKLRAGAAGQSQILVTGRNRATKGQGSLPAGTSPTAPGIAKGLERSFAGALVQVRRDDGGACFEAELPNVARSGPTYFKAKK